MVSKTLKPIDLSIKRFISDREVYVLRNSRTHTALNSSYTPEGLYWTTNEDGKLLFFKNARIESVYNSDYTVTNLKIVGDTRPSDKVYIEKFVPDNRPTKQGQIAEYTWVAKAQQLLLQAA